MSQDGLVDFIWNKYREKPYCDRIIEKYSVIKKNSCYLGCIKLDDLIHEII